MLLGEAFGESRADAPFEDRVEVLIARLIFSFLLRFRRAENREMKLAELKFEIDLVRDRDRIANLLGVRAEGRNHLLGRLDVEFVGIKAPARFIRHRLAGLDTEQD